MGVEKCFPLVLLFLSSGVLSNAQKAAEAEAGAPPAETSVTAAAGAPLTVECWLRVEQRADWRLDGAAPPADLRAAAEGAPRGGWLLARLHAAAARPAHAGLYTCARGPDARRVRVHVPAAGPAEPEPATAAAVGAAATPALASAPDHYYEINRALILNCTNPDVDKDTYTWSKNDTEVSMVLDLVKRYELLEGDAVFKVKQALEEDYGNYTCVSGGGGWRAAWRVRGKPHARLPANTNVVEGQKLKLQCKVVGKPHPVVTWTYRNSSGPEGGSPLQEGGRLRLEAGEGGVPGATLVLEEAQRADAGEYTCVPGEVGVRATTTLRVKDMYAALWPFLGICAEVFVLCAIILVYEKRRTKPELDDSDTDNHDQKKS